MVYKMIKMNKETVDNILMIGKFMGVKHLFPLQYKDDKPDEYTGVYIAEDEDGGLVYYEDGINFYDPHSNWNVLMPVCKKIIQSYSDQRSDLFDALESCEIKDVFNAAVGFLKFWNDKNQSKHVWLGENLGGNGARIMPCNGTIVGHGLNRKVKEDERIEVGDIYFKFIVD